MQYFTQIAYYIMFQSYENPEGSNPMPDSIEAVLQTFMMSLGSFGGHWWDLESTNHSFIGKVIQGLQSQRTLFKFQFVR